MPVSEVSAWLYATPVSTHLRDADWIVPTVQSIHIVAIAILMGSSIVLNLRLAGLMARTDSAPVVRQRYLPWLWAALAVLLMTGLVLVIAEPDRVLANWVFWTKMLLVVVAFITTVTIRVPMRDDFAAKAGAWRIIAKPLAVLSLIMWVLVIVCGRWIAYAL
jgi:hypothetical protein